MEEGTWSFGLWLALESPMARADSTSEQPYPFSAAARLQQQPHPILGSGWSLETTAESCDRLWWSSSRLWLVLWWSSRWPSAGAVVLWLGGEQGLLTTKGGSAKAGGLAGRSAKDGGPAGAHKRLITSPPVAVFPHPLASDLTFSRYWNYLRKQTFVLESYTTYINRIMNRALFSVHCYLSWGFVAPYIMTLIHVGAALRFRSKEYILEQPILNPNGLVLAVCLTICTAIELLSMWNLTRIEVRLCNMLSPEAPPLSLRTYNWSLVFVAMVVDNFLYPISAVRSHFSQSINWSGIRYHLRNGKISKIERTKEKGRKFSDLAAKRLYRKKGGQATVSILGSLSRSLTHWRTPKEV